jgi:hypothetical protein
VELSDPGMDYAGAVSTQRARCFRFVYDDQGKPANCPKPLVATGWTQIGPAWNQVDACTEHATQLMKPGPYRPAGRQGQAQAN